MVFGEEKENTSTRKLAMLTCGNFVGKNWNVSMRKFVIDGNEKADELAKAGAMLDEGFTAKREQRQSSRSEKWCMQQRAFTVW